MAALYLRGAPRPADPPRRGWPAVLAALRREGTGDPERTLHASGMALPATVLSTTGLLDWAEGAVEAGTVLTPVSEGYPLRWLEVFGDLAPPALWRDGKVPLVPWVGAVGSRQILEDTASAMGEIARKVAETGKGLVSGGAYGCDAAAEGAALANGGAVLRILPHGLGLRPADDEATEISLAAPDEPFSRPLAMERNALIYAAAEATIVGHVRMRQGGTWHGATNALRRRLGRVLVRADGSPAARALVALGGEAMEGPEGLVELLDRPASQRALFAYERARRRGGPPGHRRP